MSRHHIIISGTGRAGTTFLVQLFTCLGFNTGFPNITSAMYEQSNAGMEWDIRHPDAPYIIKSPWLCDYLDSVLSHGEVTIDQAIIPVRSLYSAAESRRDVTRRTPCGQNVDGIPGGLWHTDDPHAQETVLASQLYKIIYTIAKWDIPIILLHFPRLLDDPVYLYRKLGGLLSGVSQAAFLEGFERVAKPELVHRFQEPSSLS